MKNYIVEELGDTNKFRLLRKISYDDLVSFVFEYLGKRSLLMIFFWGTCMLFLGVAIYFRIEIAGLYPLSSIILHSILGFIVLPLLSIPLHELLHAAPYYLTGARDIRAGMDLRQLMFYVTAHRYVAGPKQFMMVAAFPFLSISASLLILVLFVPGLWKWSLTLFLFLHATMCGGDFALLNFYYLNRGKKIYTWDDAETKDAYFYEEISEL